MRQFGLCIFGIIEIPLSLDGDAEAPVYLPYASYECYLIFLNSSVIQEFLMMSAKFHIYFGTLIFRLSLKRDPEALVYLYKWSKERKRADSTSSCKSILKSNLLYIKGYYGC